ncbi:MAG: murein L,D-transpeptidase [Hyphomicrobiaceae bacterium]
MKAVRTVPLLLALSLPLSGAFAETGSNEASAAPPAAQSPVPAADSVKTARTTPVDPDTVAKPENPDAEAKPSQDDAAANAQPPAAEGNEASILDAVPGGLSAPDPLTPKEVDEPPPSAPGAAAVISKPHQAVEAVDPIIAALRAKSTDASAAKGSDQAGLSDFYAATDEALWVGKDGLNEKGKEALAELANAEDFGLDPSKLQIPAAPAAGAGAEQLADSEIAISRAVLTYARHARGGRIDPPSLTPLLDRRPRIYAPKTVLEGIAAAPEADAYLRGLHPQYKQFKLLQKALVALKLPKPEDAKNVRVPDGPSLKSGDKHPQVALLRQRLGVEPGDAPETFDDAVLAAVESFQREHGLTADGIVGPGTRNALNGRVPGSVEGRRRLLIANMERWRWMPDDLGRFYVWNNVPEQFTRVYKDGEVVLREKIVVGKAQTPTNIFSASMKYIIFHPTWGVPDGIKTNELAPMLRRTSNNNDWFFGGGGPSASSVLERVGGLQASIGGRPINPDSIDWSRIDIRRVAFTQPAGPRNVLGVVKFRFPNKHDIYMHDTPERHLFNGSSRAFSHGCMRVQNPMRLAEVLLAHDKGWSAGTVHGYVDNRSGTQDITLSTPIPVHVVYFTAVADDNGDVHTFRDLYGIDSRVASALEGRPVRVASAADRDDGEPRASSQRRARNRPAPAQPAYRPSNSGNPFAAIFGNF